MFTIKISGIYIHLVSIIFLLVLVCFLVSVVYVFDFYAFADSFVVVVLSACYTLLSICQATSGQMAGTTVTAFLFLVCACCYTSIWFSILFSVLISSECSVSPNLLKMVECAFCASTLLAHTSICSFVMFSFPLLFVSCFIISIIMSLPFSPCINYSFNCVSIYL